ncbi:MAG: hypothetical protein WEE36_10875 [Acidimicrobiia bacterium]
MGRGPGRVVASHLIARRAFVSALGFALISVGWSARVLVAGGSWWGPLHSFLAGTVLLAISGASQMFTITWSATVPPSRTGVLSQRWLIIAGVASALVGVTYRVPLLVWIGGGATVAGVALLGALIYGAIRRSLLRRFDLSSRFYLTAFAAGAVGITLGTMMGAGVVAGSWPTVRLVHVHLNVVGLVGLTILGTIPTLLPTTAYNRAVSGREARVAWWVALLGTAAIGFGLWIPELVGAGTIAISVAGLLILGGILFRLGKRGLHKLAFLQITVGTLWLIGWGLVNGIRVADSGTMTMFSGWTGAVVVAGIGQVLVGSLAYLVPVLRGSPFVANREIMERRAWLPLVTLNAAGFLVGAGALAWAAVPFLAWLADFAVRLVRVIAGRAPTEA